MAGRCTRVPRDDRLTRPGCPGTSPGPAPSQRHGTRDAAPARPVGTPAPLGTAGAGGAGRPRRARRALGGERLAPRRGDRVGMEGRADGDVGPGLPAAHGVPAHAHARAGSGAESSARAGPLTAPGTGPADGAAPAPDPADRGRPRVTSRGSPDDQCLDAAPDGGVVAVSVGAEGRPRGARRRVRDRACRAARCSPRRRWRGTRRRGRRCAGRSGARPARHRGHRSHGSPWAWTSVRLSQGTALGDERGRTGAPAW